MFSKVLKKGNRNDVNQKENEQDVMINDATQKNLRVRKESRDTNLENAHGEETHDQKIERILKNSFVAKYLEDDGVTDINFDGILLRIQHNQKGPRIVEERPSKEEVQRLTKQISDNQKKQFTDSDPILDTEFGFIRVSAVHEASSPEGLSFSFRISRPRLAVASISEMTYGNNKDIEQLLEALIKAERNVIIAGQTGSGKTELQKMLVGPISTDKIIALIEDTRDSHIKKLYPDKFIYSWQTLLSDQRQKKITMSDLVKAALRNNPNWVIISETRGSEAADILDSVKTDHAIITTIHATGAANVPSRLVPMIRQAPAYSIMSDKIVGLEIVEFLRFGVYMQYEFENGMITRKIKEIMEYTDYTDKGAEGIYLYRHTYDYDEKTNEYHPKEIYNPLSDKSIEVFKDKRMLHLLPDVFKTKVQ